MAAGIPRLLCSVAQSVPMSEMLLLLLLLKKAREPEFTNLSGLVVGTSYQNSL